MSQYYNHEMLTVSRVLEGRYMRANPGGIVLDECENSAVHMEAPPDPKENRRRCLIALDSLIPTAMFGRKGKFTITVCFEPDL